MVGALAHCSAEHSTAEPDLPRNRLVDVTITDVDALVAGLPRGGTVRCLVIPATDLPTDLWSAAARSAKPIGLVTHLDGEDVTGTELLEVGPPTSPSHTVVASDRVVTILFPVTKVVIVGTGPIADASAPRLPCSAGRRRHQRRVDRHRPHRGAGSARQARGRRARHRARRHRRSSAALDSDVGYIGAIGGRNGCAKSRADWLAYRGVTDIDRIHGPAGLDIGADTPAKVAISILAEAIAVEAGRDRSRVHWIPMTQPVR